MIWGIVSIFAAAGAGAGLLASFVLARARSPALVPRVPVALGTAALWAFVAWRWWPGASRGTRWSRAMPSSAVASAAVPSGDLPSNAVSSNALASGGVPTSGWLSGSWALTGWSSGAQPPGGLPSWWLPVPLVLTALAVPLLAADLRYRRLPDVLTVRAYPVLGLALGIAALSGPGIGLLLRALGAGVAFGGLHLLVHALSRRSLGAGDVKLAGALGAVLGAVSWAALVVAAVLAAVLTTVLAAIQVAVRRRRDGVPHGPGLLVAAWLVAVFPGTGGHLT